MPVLDRLHEAATPSPPKAFPHAPAARPWVILLAGGEGRRLSSLVGHFHADQRPKQFAVLIGTRSLLVHTYSRALRHTSPDRIIVVITEGQQRWALPQLSMAPTRNILIQPRGLDTGPAILLALAHVMAADPEASFLLFPSDHFIFPEERFEKAVGRMLSAVDAIQRKRTILLGAKPTGPSTGMGWVVQEGALEEGGRPGLFKVKRFVEKPGPVTAQHLYAASALWNTFILAGKAQHLWYLFWNRCPEAITRVTRYYKLLQRGAWKREADVTFDGIAPFNFSTHVLAWEPEELLVAPLTGVEWSDWGTPEGVRESLASLGWGHKMPGQALAHPAAC